MAVLFWVHCELAASQESRFDTSDSTLTPSPNPFPKVLSRIRVPRMATEWQLITSAIWRRKWLITLAFQHTYTLALHCCWDRFCRLERPMMTAAVLDAAAVAEEDDETAFKVKHHRPSALYSRSPSLISERTMTLHPLPSAVWEHLILDLHSNDRHG